MQDLAPEHSVERIDAHREIHWTATGLWTEAKMAELFADLLVASKPYREDRKGFRVLGDLRQFAVQPRTVAEQMEQSQQATAKIGVDRMAILASSVLVKQQFRRVSEALDCQFFESKTEALAWLRADR